MSSWNNKDWDLCWYYSSSTGCRKENCTWRHEISMDRHFQNRYKKKRSMRGYHRRDSWWKPSVPFYLINQHNNGGIEEHHSSAFWPEVGNRHVSSVSSQPIRKYRYQRGAENFRLVSSSISESSQCIASAVTSTANSIKSRGGSNSDGEEIKNAEVVSGKEVKNQKEKSSIGVEVQGDVKTPKKLLKANVNLDKKIASVLSPFAKVFIPRVNLARSTSERKATLEESKVENIPSTKMKLPLDVEAGQTIIDEVKE